MAQSIYLTNTETFLSCKFTIRFPPKSQHSLFTVFSFLRSAKNNQQQQTPEFTMNNNPVYVVHKLSQSVSLTQQQHQQQQQEPVFDMDHNPLYSLNTRPQHTNNNPSAGHEYETVQPVQL